MDLFEKIGEVAKNMTEKAEDGLEINRLGGEISIEKGNIQCYKQELGEYFWAKFVLGELDDEEAALICDKVVGSQDCIKTLEAEIEQVKQNRKVQKEEERLAKVQEPETSVTPEMESEPKVVVATLAGCCKNCGQRVSEGQKFCGYCGKEVEK